MTQEYNTTTTHYGIRYAIVARCERCALFHQYLRKVGLLTMACLYPIIVLVALVPAVALGWAIVAAVQCGIIIYVVIIGAMVYLPLVFVNIPIWLAVFISSSLSRLLMLEGHTQYGDYGYTEAERSLLAEGYQITSDWRINAVNLIKTD